MTSTTVPSPGPERSGRDEPAGDTPTGSGGRPPGTDAAELARPVRRLRRWLPDLAAVAIYLTAAVLVTGRLWRDPAGRVSGSNATDATLFEWMLAHSARVVTHGENPLFSTRMSTPSGINVMANTSVLGLGIPLSPVTLVWGPSVTFLLIAVIALAGTATAWYLVLARHVTASRLAAFVGGAFCGFCPGLISQAGGHPHIAFQVLVPFIIAGVLRLGTTGRPVRDGVILGLLITYQAFIGEETLFVTASVCAVWLLAWAVQRGREVAGQWRPFVTGLAVAGLVAGVLLAYPLSVQFLGPQNYQHVPDIEKHGADLLAYGAYSPLDLGGDPDAPLRLAHNATELNAFFGWPLLIVTAGLIWWLRRHLLVRIAAVTAVVFAVLSLGYDVIIDGRYTGFPGPWRAVVHAPLFESVVTTRLAITVATAIGVILAVAVTELRRTRLRAPARVVLAVLLTGSLLPLLPRPLPATAAVRVPTALADGGWRDHLTGDHALMAVPPTKEAAALAMGWAASEGLGFRVTHGYFLGPDPTRGDGWAMFNTPPTATDRLLTEVARTGQVAVVTDSERAQARADLRLRNAGLLVMRVRQAHADALRGTVDALVGPGQRDGDVWLWPVPTA